jgi:transposase
MTRSGRSTVGGGPIAAPLQAQHANVAVAIARAQAFCGIIRERQVDRFDDWRARAVASRVAPLPRFATGLHADDEAVPAGIKLRWSNGPVEGQINRLKRLTRSMFGRAKLDLPSRRLLLAA